MAKHRFVQNGPGGIIAVPDEIHQFAEEVAEAADLRGLSRQSWRRTIHGGITHVGPTDPHQKGDR